MKTRLAMGLVLVVGCASVMKSVELPPNPRRKTPPPGVEATALAVGARVPAVSVTMSDGTTAPLTGRPTALLLYRGSW
ncbi:MAG: hypothetical protein IAE78_01500 [Myxococcus sp.]|nr:hypothetical protein [Myxococcus sp.]